jgi:hypothetical protein
MKLKKQRLIGAFAACLLGFMNSVCAQGTAFTYQGHLQNNGNPALGSYDFTFALYNNNSTNNGAIGNPLTIPNVGVSNGLFTVALDFGNQFNSQPIWMAIGVRTNGGTNFTALNPLQELTPVPYAIYAAAAGTAGSVSAANISGTISAANLPASVMTNNAANVALSGSFSGTFNGLPVLPGDSVNVNNNGVSIPTNLFSVGTNNMIGAVTAGPLTDPARSQLSGFTTKNFVYQVGIFNSGLIGYSNWIPLWTNETPYFPGVYCAGKVDAESNTFALVNAIASSSNLTVVNSNVVLKFDAHGNCFATNPLVMLDGSPETNNVEDIEFVPLPGWSNYAIGVIFANQPQNAWGGTNLLVFSTNGLCWTNVGTIPLDAPIYGVGGICWSPQLQKLVCNAGNYLAAYNTTINALYSIGLDGHVSFLTLQYLPTPLLSNSVFQAYGQGSPFFATNDYSQVSVAMNWYVHGFGTTNNIMTWQLTNNPAFWVDESGTANADNFAANNITASNVAVVNLVATGSLQAFNLSGFDDIESGTSSAIQAIETPGGGYFYSGVWGDNTMQFSVDWAGDIWGAGTLASGSLTTGSLAGIGPGGVLQNWNLGRGLSFDGASLNVTTPNVAVITNLSLVGPILPAGPAPSATNIQFGVSANAAATWSTNLYVNTPLGGMIYVTNAQNGPAAPYVFTNWFPANANFSQPPVIVVSSIGVNSISRGSSAMGWAPSIITSNYFVMGVSADTGSGTNVGYGMAWTIIAQTNVMTTKLQ